jgi:sigma-E factor negative regulatory protein RseB
VPLDFSRLGRHYRIRHLGRFRIAGRDTDVVGVLARDAFRYGYRFYVDQASGLPLKVDLLAEDETPIQQIMFTEIEIEPEAGAADAAEQAPGAEPAAAGEPPLTADGPTPDWLPKRLPPGFLVVSEKRLPRDDGATIRQLVVSDGLASFSIYLEPPIDGALRGESRLGAVSAAGGQVGAHQATVVGEVPPDTVRRVLADGAPQSGP